MFLANTRSWYSSNGQRTEGMFLVLFDRSQPGTCRSLRRPSGAWDLRACARRVLLAQFGHFMMGKVDIGGWECPLSGPYGKDGLPRSADEMPDAIWDDLVSLPDELCDAYSKSEGGNHGTSVDPQVFDWAKENLPRLMQAGRKNRLARAKEA